MSNPEATRQAGNIDDLGGLDTHTGQLKLDGGQEGKYESRVREICQEDSSSESHHLRLNALKWIYFARHPLTFAELGDVLTATTDSENTQARTLSKEEIIEQCRGLISDFNGQAAFTDPSIRSLLDDANIFQAGPLAGNRELALQCITYLSTVTDGACKYDREMASRYDSHPFFAYAARNWGHHASASYAPAPTTAASLGSDDGLQSAVVAFLMNDPVREAMVQALYVDPSSTVFGWCDFYPKSTTPLHIAAYFDLVPAARNIISQEGDTSSDVSLLSARNSDGQSPLHVAASTGANGFIKLLLSLPQIDINDVAGSHANNGGGTALCFAAGNGRYNACHLLLSHGASVMRAWPKSGWGPLLAASKGGYANIVSLLLANGGVVSGRNKDGRSPLLEAVEGGHVGVVKVLLDKGAGKEMLVPTFGYDKTTPLKAAAAAGDEVIMEMLLDDAENEGLKVDGAPLLSAAAEKGNTDIIGLLLERGLVQDDAIGAAVYQAAYKGQVNVVDLFIEYGRGDIVGYRNSANGWTSIHAAAHKHDFQWSADTIRKLAATGVDLDALDNDGEAAMHRAADRRHKMNMEALIQAGGNVNLRKADGMTPMHVAVAQGTADIVELLLKDAKLDLNTRDNQGRTVLHIAAEREHLSSPVKAYFSGSSKMREESVFATHEIVEMIALSDQGKKILNAVDKNGKTALHVCSETGNAGVAQFLVKYGADINVEDFHGLRARQIAETNGLGRVVMALDGQMIEVIPRPWKRRADPKHAAALAARREMEGTPSSPSHDQGPPFSNETGS